MKIRLSSSIALLIATLATPGAVLALPTAQESPQTAPPAEEATKPAAGGAETGAAAVPAPAVAPAVPPAAGGAANGALHRGNGPAGGRKDGGKDELVGLQFREQEIKSLIDTISLWTGKVVIPKQTALAPIKITIVSDKLMRKSEALNLIFQAFRLNGLGVVETEEMILIDNLTELNQLQPAKVLGPDVEINALPENGNIVIKVFRIKNTKASQVYERLQDSLPSYASLQVDNNSNQIILEGDIALAKRLQRLIDLLDVTAYVDVRTKTIKLAYQDAQTIAGIITDLFSARAPTGGASTPRAGGAAGGQQQGQQRGRPGQQQGSGELVGTSEQLVVTVLPATNSMTIRAEPNIMKEIEALISVLDAPRSNDEQPIFRTYELKYTDPLKVQAVLQSLLEGGASGGGARRTGQAGRGAAAGGVQRIGGLGGGSGSESGADVAIANIFKIEAYPDSNRLIVVSKTPDNFLWLDEMVAQIDQPLQAGMPRNIALKHASAVEVAEILNALLAQTGASASIRAPQEGLSGIDFRSAGGASASSSQNGVSNNNAFASGNTNTGGGQQAGQIQFPWQGGRAGGDTETEVSALVGKSRVVPNAGQNSLLILAPQEIQESLAQIVSDLDKPGRQVMINVILAEVQLGDELQFGIKWGKGVQPTNPNNAIVVTGDSGAIFKGTKNDIFPPDLTTSALAFNIDANVVLQALAEQTTVRILQQPRVFTSDNKEAKFFQGQDVPFQNSNVTDLNTGGGVNATFEQIPVGIGLNVRPRITKDRNVAMQIEVLLSNVNLTQVGVGNNPVIDRRQTNTTITVKNGQTIVLSGIRKETENKIKTKVPFLGDVPVLDWVFASTDNTKSTTELVVFVTPVVVDNPDENDRNYNAGERDRLRELVKPLNEMSAKEVGRAKMLIGDGSPDPINPANPLNPIQFQQGPDSSQPPAPVKLAPTAPANPKAPAPGGSTAAPPKAGTVAAGPAKTAPTAAGSPAAPAGTPAPAPGSAPAASSTE
ncbi:MAG: secretin N-terminal domain-containing protein [Phycisphaerales bacterium]